MNACFTLCVLTYLHVCVHVCVYVYVHACVCVCVRACAYTYIQDIHQKLGHSPYPLSQVDILAPKNQVLTTVNLLLLLLHKMISKGNHINKNLCHTNMHLISKHNPPSKFCATYNECTDLKFIC